MLHAQCWLRRLWAQYERGSGCFAQHMGLSLSEWQRLLERMDAVPSVNCPEREQRYALLNELQSPRTEEREQLADWLYEHMSRDAAPMHRIIASASLGFNHLWQDLGLDSRNELRELMTDCFPSLVEMNATNMRWKKFFYRQRCLHSEGELICRSPSCDDCCEWAHCFAPEV
ncbi:nitrogen fixation protein NifQ [Pectobacterium atrosepticum]|uniref:nitrogen fixation protein NifQ n=1 Tax=Pectobacterium atrosepticum TaxID=29471 RepID=UPI00049A1F2C|nr:nitrogen fixation protein NifQ [Pectobacterium atrosepticum]AIA71762.1 iron-molybdenum cofactor biosynthesis protein NifQ [Pectobacterium atrosepticum]AIK14720.1 nitrogen fixation protein [Pectobacterium atrosepticum]POW31311.1 nitrogen fixation protein NifQ [Pectobacterium atrosepticum]